jgi:amino acid adenylation domain-containing protein
MLLQQQFFESVNKYQDKVALLVEDTKLTYTEIAEKVECLSIFLQENGIMHGDRVALFTSNSVEMIIGLYAALHIGAVFMPISSQTKLQKLVYILNDSRPTSIITDARQRKTYLEALKKNNSIKVCIEINSKKKDEIKQKSIFSYEEATSKTNIKRKDPKTIDQDLAAIIYTSGSTGDPKGVMLTHLNMVSAANSISSYLRLKEDDRIMCALPLSFDYGLYQVLMAFKKGASLVLEKSYIYPIKILEKIAQENVTVFPVVPTIVSMLPDREIVKTFNLAKLQTITNTAAALTETHIKMLQEMFPKVKIFSMYGLTECKRVSYMPPEELHLRPMSVGRGMPNQELYLIDENGDRLENGNTGELVVRGSHVMRGYWEKPEQTKKRLKQGNYPNEVLLYTGDIFRTDEEGYLYFVGRKDDIIKSKGEKVSPKEVENILYEIEGVQDAAAIGVPDKIAGQVVKAFLMLRSGYCYSEREIQRYCMSKMENYMVPKYIEFVDSLPKTNTGKIRKVNLK